MINSFLHMLHTLLEYTAIPMEVPSMFGRFHLLTVFTGVFLCCVLGWKLRGLTGKRQAAFFSVCGWILVFLELYKQLFSWLVLWNGKYDWWIFPFQLCSIPMYLGVIYPHLKEKSRETCRTFLATYSLIGALCALAYPQDMLRSYVTLTAHAFLWHFLLLLISLQILFSHTVGRTKNAFGRTVCLFMGLALIATGINAFGETHVSIPGTYPDMFYISLYHPTGQIVFRTIEQYFGKPVEVLLYLMILTVTSSGVYRVISKDRRVSK